MAVKRRPEFDSRKGGLQKLWTQAPEGNVAALLELYHTSPRMDAIDIKAQHIAGTPWALYDKAAWDESPDEAQPIKNHPAIELLTNPCPAYPEIDGAVLMYLTYVYKRVTGEAYWWKIRNGSAIESLYIMPKSWCLQTPSLGSPYFLFVPSGVAGGQAIKAAPEDMVWFKSPNVTDPYSRGRGRSENMLDEYESDELAAKYAKNYFYNDATPPLAIHAPGASPEEVEQLKTSWLQRVGGFLKARAPAFLTWEGAKVEKLSDSAREMDFVESRKFLRDMANQHEQLPPEIAGILENSNRATIDAAYYLFTKSALTPEFASLDATITRQLIASDYDDRIVYRHKNTVPQDEAFKLTKVNAGAERGMLTRAEWRKAMGYPVDESKDNVYVVPFSLTEMKPGEKPEPEPAPAPEAAPAEPPAKTIEFSITKSAKGHFTPEQKSAIWKTFDATAVSGEGLFSKAVEKLAAAQAKLFHDTFKSELGNSRDFAGAVERTCQKVLGKTADAAVKSGLAPAWLKSMKQGFELAQEVLGRGLDFSLYDPKFNAWVDQAGLMKAKEINDTTRAALREKLAAEVSEGVQSGESMSKIAARIREATDGVYDNMSKNRAKVIARTETMSSVNTGEFEVYKGEGVTKKEWLATQDDRTRDEHAAADGQIVGIDEPFIVGGEALQYPGDPTGSAGEVIQCRCTVLPVLEE